MSSKRKFNRKSKYTLSQKIISAVTAAGFIMQPFAGFAQSINKVNGNNGTITVENNVTHIWADKVVGNSAINSFKDFQLDANNIANMYFGLKDTDHNSANLVNFVNSRIDINGTVNAVQNNKIGGNLFFLSKDGMAVGKSGVINTGSLYVMTPATGIPGATGTVEDYNATYEGLKGIFNSGQEYFVIKEQSDIVVHEDPDRRFEHVEYGKAESNRENDRHYREYEKKYEERRYHQVRYLILSHLKQCVLQLTLFSENGSCAVFHVFRPSPYLKSSATGSPNS